MTFLTIFWHRSHYSAQEVSEDYHSFIPGIPCFCQKPIIKKKIKSKLEIQVINIRIAIPTKSTMLITNLNEFVKFLLKLTK